VASNAKNATSLALAWLKSPSEWAFKGAGPRYAQIGRHVRYRLSDVIDWEGK
jgi:hypothetical protein